MKILYSDYFLKSARHLPKEQQKKLASLMEVLNKNPFSFKLHTKYLTGKLSGFYSFRITRDWRAIFRFLDTQTIQLVDVAHRKDIYKS